MYTTTAVREQLGTSADGELTLEQLMESFDRLLPSSWDRYYASGSQAFRTEEDEFSWGDSGTPNTFTVMFKEGASVCIATVSERDGVSTLFLAQDWRLIAERVLAFLAANGPKD